MSTLAYAAITSRREEATPETSTTTQKPGVNYFVDLAAALVPAEVLIAHAVILDATTKAAKGGLGMTITDLPTLKWWGFYALIVASALLYLLGHIRNYGLLDIARNFIPPVAFVVWTMGQKTTAFNAAFPQMSMSSRIGATVVIALVIGAAATALAYKADRTTAPAE